jgi:hypothetical protein
MSASALPCPDVLAASTCCHRPGSSGHRPSNGVPVSNPPSSGNRPVAGSVRRFLCGVIGFVLGYLTVEITIGVAVATATDVPTAVWSAVPLAGGIAGAIFAVRRARRIQ